MKRKINVFLFAAAISTVAGNTYAQTMDRIVIDQATKTAIGEFESGNDHTVVHPQKASVNKNINTIKVRQMPDADKYRVATNKFFDNWQLQLGIQDAAFYSNQEVGKELSLSPFNGFRNSSGFSAAVAKWFSPDIALRTKFTGMWAKSVNGDIASENKARYFFLQEQVLINLTNIICGYEQNRFYNLIPYCGIGYVRNISYNRNNVGMSAGLHNSFRLSDRFNAYLELGAAGTNADFDVIPQQKIKNIIKRRDKWLTAEIGLSLSLGKHKWDVVPNMDALQVVPWDETIAAYNDRIKEQQERINALNKQLENCNGDTIYSVKTITETNEVSVFFEVNSAELKKKEQLENIKKLVEIGRKYNARFIVTGYADSFTGNEKINRKLSEKRAQTIADEIAKMGIKRNRIVAIAGGGVAILEQIPANRRATVKLEIK